MTATGMDTRDMAALEAMLGPGLTPEQAEAIFAQGRDAVVFALLILAKQVAEKTACLHTPAPSTPSGQTPVYTKPTRGK